MLGDLDQRLTRRAVDEGGHPQPLKMQAGEDGVHLVGNLLGGEVKAPVVLAVKVKGVEAELAVGVVGQLAVALFGQATEAHLDILQ